MVCQVAANVLNRTVMGGLKNNWNKFRGGAMQVFTPTHLIHLAGRYVPAIADHYEAGKTRQNWQSVHQKTADKAVQLLYGLR